MRFDRSTGRQNLGTGCGYGKENGVVVWCVHCSVSFQSFVLRHLVIAPFCNTKKLLVVSIQVVSIQTQAVKFWVSIFVL